MSLAASGPGKIGTLSIFYFHVEMNRLQVVATWHFGQAAEIHRKTLASSLEALGLASGNPLNIRPKKAFSS